MTDTDPLPILSLLGRADAPTDALEDYCTWLKRALEQQGQPMEILRVPGLQMAGSVGSRGHGAKRKTGAAAGFYCNTPRSDGRSADFRLARQSQSGSPAIAARNAQLFFMTLCRTARPRFIDRIRRVVQVWVMRKLYRLALHSIMTVPVENVSWLPRPATKAEFIPIAANLSGTLVKLNDIQFRSRK